MASWSTRRDFTPYYRCERYALTVPAAASLGIRRATWNSIIRVGMSFTETARRTNSNARHVPVVNVKLITNNCGAGRPNRTAATRLATRFGLFNFCGPPVNNWNLSRYRNVQFRQSIEPSSPPQKREKVTKRFHDRFARTMDDDPRCRKRNSFPSISRWLCARRPRVFRPLNSEIRKRSRENHKYAVLFVGACDGHKLTLKKHHYDLNTKIKRVIFVQTRLSQSYVIVHGTA